MTELANAAHQKTSASVCIVTGAGSGLGREIALALAQAGHWVYATMRDPGGRNRVKAEELSDIGLDKLRILELDVNDDGSAQAGVRSVLAEQGRIDVLVNNAGIMYQGVTEAYDMNDARSLMETNFFSVVRMNRLVLPAMRDQRHGLLVHISSIAGSVVFPYAGLYSASKMAIEGLAESYRYELQSHQVDSVIVQPCPYPSSLLDSQRDPSDKDRLQSYGGQAAIAQQRVTTTRAWHASGSAPAPSEVGDIVAGLVALPFGERQMRIVAGGMDFGARQINKAKDIAQQKVASAFRHEA